MHTCDIKYNVSYVGMVYAARAHEDMAYKDSSIACAVVIAYIVMAYLHNGSLCSRSYVLFIA